MFKKVVDEIKKEMGSRNTLDFKLKFLNRVNIAPICFQEI